LLTAKTTSRSGSKSDVNEDDNGLEENVVTDRVRGAKGPKMPCFDEMDEWMLFAFLLF